MFSLEIGKVPLYACVNSALSAYSKQTEIPSTTQGADQDISNDLSSTNSSMSLLEPYIIALSYSVSAAESKREINDRIESGSMLGGKNFNLGGLFLVWRGTKFN